MFITSNNFYNAGVAHKYFFYSILGLCFPIPRGIMVASSKPECVIGNMSWQFNNLLVFSIELCAVISDYEHITKSCCDECCM